MLPLKNIASGNRAFLADPFSQFCAMRGLTINGLQLLGIFSSHPDGGVDPSEEDLVYARRWRCAHIVIAVTSHERSQARIQAFRFNELGCIEDVKVELKPTRTFNSVQAVNTPNLTHPPPISVAVGTSRLPCRSNKQPIERNNPL